MNTIHQLAVSMVVRENPPEMTLSQISSWMQQGLSIEEIANQFGVSESVVYRKSRMHPCYRELKRIQAGKRRELHAHAACTYWNMAAKLTNRGYPVDRVFKSELSYQDDFGTAECFSKALKSATLKHPHLAVVH